MDSEPSRSLFKQVTGISSSGLLSPLGISSQGTPFINKVMSFFPPFGIERDKTILKQGLINAWPNREFRLRGSNYLGWLNDPAYTKLEELIRNYINHQLSQRLEVDPLVIIGVTEGPIKDYMRGIIYLDFSVLPLISSMFNTQELSDIKKESIKLWSKRDYPNEDMARILNEKVYNSQFLKYSRSVKTAFDACDRDPNFTDPSDRIICKRGRLAAYALLIVNGPTDVLKEGFITNSQHQIIATRNEREHEGVGKSFGLPLILPGDSGSSLSLEKSGIKQLPPLQGELFRQSPDSQGLWEVPLAKGAVHEEPATPVNLYPTPDGYGTKFLGGRRKTRRKHKHKHRKSKKTRSRR